MWKRVCEHLLNGMVIVLLLVWFACSVGIAIWVEAHTDVEMRRRGWSGLVMLIWLVPVGVVTAVNEFVVRRIRYGPPAPGRRKRTPWDRA